MHHTAAPHHAPGTTPVERVKRARTFGELTAALAAADEDPPAPALAAAPRRVLRDRRRAPKPAVPPDHPAAVLERHAAAAGRANPLPAQAARTWAAQAGETEALATFTDEQWHLAGASMRAASVHRTARQRQAFVGLLTGSEHAERTTSRRAAFSVLLHRLAPRLASRYFRGHRPPWLDPRRSKPTQHQRRLVLLTSGTLTAAPPALPSRAAAGLILAA